MDPSSHAPIPPNGPQDEGPELGPLHSPGAAEEPSQGPPPAEGEEEQWSLGATAAAGASAPGPAPEAERAPSLDLGPSLAALRAAYRAGRWTEAVSEAERLLEAWRELPLEADAGGAELLADLGVPPLPRRVPQPALPPGSGLALCQRVLRLAVAAQLQDDARPQLQRYQGLKTWLDGAEARLAPAHYRRALPWIVGYKRECYSRIPPELQDFRVDPDELNLRTRQQLSPFQRFVRFLWARFHLTVRCNFCLSEDRRSHDARCEGECWFRRRWQEGRYEVPLWMGWVENVRLERVKLAHKRHKLPLLEPPSPPLPPPVKTRASGEAVQPAPRPQRPELKLVTVPNMLTLTRVALLPAIIVAIRLDSGLGYFLAFVLACLGEITDFTDGYVARMRGEVSALGKLLDPMADTITRFSIFLTLHSVGLVPLWMVLVLFVRDMSIAYMRAFAASTGVIIAARTSGKVKAVFQGSVTLIILYLMMMGRYHGVAEDPLLHQTGWWIAMGAAALLPQIYTWLFKIRGTLLWLVRAATLALTPLLVVARFRVLPAFDPQWAVWACMLVVTLVTGYSLFDYLWGFVKVLSPPTEQA